MLYDNLITMLRDKRMTVLVSAEELELFRAAAGEDGRDLSGWVRASLNRAVRGGEMGVPETLVVKPCPDCGQMVPEPLGPGPDHDPRCYRWSIDQFRGGVAE